MLADNSRLYTLHSAGEYRTNIPYVLVCCYNEMNLNTNLNFTNNKVQILFFKFIIAISNSNI